MKRKILWATLSVALLLLWSSMGLASEKNLGYGFDPGLVPGKDFVAGQLIVGLKEGLSTDGVKGAVAAAGIQIVKEIEGAVLLQFASEQAVVEAIPALTGRPDVAFVERNGFLHVPPQPILPKEKCGGCSRTAKRNPGVLAVSADDAVGYQWHLTNIRKTAALPALSAAPPTVAVIDTGVDYHHEDLESKVIKGKNCIANTMDPFDDNGHGTHVAGIIGAEASNNDYGEGVCHNCKILAVKVCDKSGTCPFFEIVEGMKYARTAVTTPATRVINMSLGGPSSALIAAEVLNIKNAGKILVASAGNSNTSTTLDYPGADPNTALRVMASEQVNCRAWFSNFSPPTSLALYNIAAPGWEIRSTLPMAGFGPLSGTSMASPIVAGAAALVWGQSPAQTRDQIVSRLLSMGQTTRCGFAGATRVVDVRKAIVGTAETALVGHILDPFTGVGIEKVKVDLRSGLAILASDLTNEGGSYEMTGLAAGGARSLRGSRSDYITTLLRTPIVIGASVVNGPYMDALAQERSSGDATLVLDWKRSQPVNSTTNCTGPCLGWDFDLAVKTPSGTVISTANPGSLLASPFVKYARDSVDDLVPMETIVIGSAAANGVYTVYADRFPYASRFNQTYAGSLISFQAFKGSVSASPHYSSSSCGTTRYWHIGDLTKSGSSYTWANMNMCHPAIP